MSKLNDLVKKYIFVISVLFSSITICILLLFLKLPSLMSWIQSRKKIELLDDNAVSNFVHIIDKIMHFKFFIIRNNCLRKSLIYYFWLLRFGVTGVEFKIGVSLKDNKLSAHAWLTKDGQVFLDSPESILVYNVTYTSGVVDNEKTVY